MWANAICPHGTVILGAGLSEPTPYRYVLHPCATPATTADRGSPAKSTIVAAMSAAYVPTRSPRISPKIQRTILAEMSSYDLVTSGICLGFRPGLRRVGAMVRIPACQPP